MADPASAPTSVPDAIATGASALVLATFGLTLPQLGVGFMASLLGLAHAQPASPWFAASRFIASAICSASMGAAIGERMGLGSVGTNGLIVLCGLTLHLLIGYMGNRFGVIADAGLKKAGLDIDGGKQ